MDHNYECHHRTFNLSVIERAIRPSLLHYHRINFKFFCKLKCLNWVQNLGSRSRVLIRQDAYVTNCASIIVKSSLSYEEIGEAVEGALMSLPLSDKERQQLTERAWKEVHETVRTEPLCHYCEIHFNMDLQFQLRLVHDHVFHSSEEISRCRMVPVVHSCVQSLEKYEVDSGDISERCNCCICLEDFSDDDVGDAEAMEELPCSHVFHGGCINKWLRTANNCPLCRFELDADELDTFQEFSGLC